MSRNIIEISKMIESKENTRERITLSLRTSGNIVMVRQNEQEERPTIQRLLRKNIKSAEDIRKKMNELIDIQEKKSLEELIDVIYKRYEQVFSEPTLDRQIFLS